MTWLDKISLPILLAAAVFMALAPFTPEPHIVQKYNMLMAGDLYRLIDLFDVAWHLLPSVLVAIKLWRARNYEQA